MFEIAIVILLVLLNGFFALSEMAVVTSRKPRLKQMAESSKRAKTALSLSEHPERFLSTVQVGITLIPYLNGIVGGQALGSSLGAWLDAAVPALASKTAITLGSVIVAVIVTFVTIVIGELVPKRIALLAPERIATAVAVPMNAISTLAAPFVWLLSRSTRFLIQILGLDKSNADKVTDEEIRHLVAESHEQGNLDADERNMLNRVLRLGDRTAESLMTPRTLIIWLDADADFVENQDVLRSNPFSRYPVYRKDDSNVLGVLESKSLVGRECRNNEELLKSVHPALFVSESTNALRLLEIFREEQQTLALVVDEYGDILGMVTVNDLIGAVLGRIQSMEDAEDEALIVERDDGSWLIDGRLAVEELRELLNVQALPGEDDNDFTTVAGMVIAHFGRIPHTGEVFEFGVWRIEVIDLDGARIDKLLIGRKPVAEATFDQ
ncbi:hemolysin family protein [Arenimonas sp.]|jgi:putative hemolysin|uniref:hemolysin family protein n=1 Tax=Arenimonas sp. TaxID=1872635 RepID=UPI0037C0B142